MARCPPRLNQKHPPLQKESVVISESKPVGSQMEIAPATKKETSGARSFLFGGTVSLVNTFGEIHQYLDTVVGFGVFTQYKPGFDFLPIFLLGHLGYFKAASYRVQSMSFFYLQAGAGWPAQLPFDILLTHYAAVGLHTGKYIAFSGTISTDFMLASFDADALISYNLSSQVGIALKTGWMPVLDKYVSTNFWHLGCGAIYAL